MLREIGLEVSAIKLTYSSAKEQYSVFLHGCLSTQVVSYIIFTLLIHYNKIIR